MFLWAACCLSRPDHHRLFNFTVSVLFEEKNLYSFGGENFLSFYTIISMAGILTRKPRPSEDTFKFSNLKRLHIKYGLTKTNSLFLEDQMFKNADS